MCPVLPANRRNFIDPGLSNRLSRRSAPSFKIGRCCADRGPHRISFKSRRYPNTKQLLAAANSAAADSFTLQVIDPAGAAISGAAVLIVNEKTGKQTHYAAGTDGKLHLADIAPGIYEVSVHASGFKWHKVSHLELPSHEVITLRLDLAVLMGEVVSVRQETEPVVATESLVETPRLNFPVTLRGPDNRSAIQRFFSKIRRIF